MKTILALTLSAVICACNCTAHAASVSCSTLNPIFSCKSANTIGNSIFIEEPVVLIDAQRTALIKESSSYSKAGAAICKAFGYKSGSVGDYDYARSKCLAVDLADDGSVNEVSEIDPSSSTLIVQTVTCRK